MIYLLLALFVGALLPLQAAINATLRAPLGGPVQAALASVLVSFVTLSGFVIASRTPVPQNLGAVAPWAWTGGLLGAFYLVMTTFLTPKLGAATTFGLVICGQLLASLALDQFGFLGVPQHALNAPRVLGAVFLLIGVVLIRRF